MAQTKTQRTIQRRITPVGWTVLCTFGCMIGSAIYTTVIFQGDSLVVLQKAVIASFLLPIFLGTPIYYYLIKRMRALSFRNMRLQAMSMRDGLTHCLNQASFKKYVESYLKETGIGGHRKAALLVIDADHFKQINDNFGHDVGDEAIRLIADKVRGVVRRRDVVGRIGGEEFAVLLRDADSKIASSVAERIRSAVNLAEVNTKLATHRLSVSVGGVLFEDDVQFRQLFRTADSNLYEAKAAGRNQVRIGEVTEASAEFAAVG